VSLNFKFALLFSRECRRPPSGHNFTALTKTKFFFSLAGRSRTRPSLPAFAPQFSINSTFDSSHGGRHAHDFEVKTPQLVTALPGPNAKRVIEQDAKYVSLSYTRDYPLVAKRGRGAMVERPWMETCSWILRGHRRLRHGAAAIPEVVAAIQKQARN